MALQAAKTLDNGLVANYWRIIAVDYSVINNRLIMDMELYADNTARQAGYLPAFTTTFQFYKISNSDINAIVAGGTLIPGMYTFLKTQQQFLNAIDV